MQDGKKSGANGASEGENKAAARCDAPTMISIALPKGRLGEKVYAMFEAAGYRCPSIRENSRKLIFENPDAGVRYFWVKPSDVPIYVERGAADVGVAGKDILLEYEPDVYELLDLGLGKCRMAVAAKQDFYDSGERTLRVATKFPEIARQHYAGRCRDIDVIKLNGSIELAPILGMSDVIVDIRHHAAREQSRGAGDHIPDQRPADCEPVGVPLQNRRNRSHHTKNERAGGER